MSFINSVLAGLNGEGGASSSAHTRPAVSSTQSSVPPSSTTNPASSPTQSTPNQSNGIGQKRKAEDEIGRQLVEGSKKARAPSSSAEASRLQHKTPMPVTRVGTIDKTPIAKVTAKDGPQAPPSSDALSPPKPPPRKGTFAETLARAKAAQSAAAQVGAIKHKPYITIKERKALEERARVAAQASKRQLGGDQKRSVGYKGTAQSKANGFGSKDTSQQAKDSADTKGAHRKPRQELAYKGTSRVHTSATTPKDRERSRSSSTQQQGRYRYANYSDESEDGPDVDSEGSSDMEAATHELEEEEFRSLRTARKEDEEALREEFELKRAKEEKKRRLKAMVAKRQ